MASAYHYKLARVNLTTRKIRIEPLNIELAEKFIGGRGLGTKILYDEGIAKVEPLSPENKLLYLSGPLTGTATPTGTRFMVLTKSPLTGMIASSNSGGTWGAKLKYAGFDGIIIEGKADETTFIHINDGEITLYNADEYIGMSSGEIDERLKERFPKSSVLNIGLAGEKLSLVSCIMNDKDRA